MRIPASTESVAEIPKLIWMMWLQGLSQAPVLVEKCYASWRSMNPDWPVVFLEEANLQEHIDVRAVVSDQRQDISRQALSDVVRINLLAKYGGVWADATTFACTPLDAWLDKYSRPGFFAFRNPGPDRMLSSWFLASAKDCYLTSRWCKEVNRFIGGQSFSNRTDTRVQQRADQLAKFLNQHRWGARLWSMCLIAKVCKTYPYFWFHYLFAGLVNRDLRFRQIWRNTPGFSADIPHKLQAAGLLKALPPDVKEDIDSKKDPLYKLAWNYNRAKYREGCTLDYLLRS